MEAVGEAAGREETLAPKMDMVEEEGVEEEELAGASAQS